MTDSQLPVPAMPESSRSGEGAPRFVTMDGILDGRLGDAAAIAQAVAALNALGICAFELDRDGGKFSVLPNNARMPAAGFDRGKQEQLLQHLRRIAAAARGPVESTLRCTMVFEEDCTETLFRATSPPPNGAGIEPLTRVRPARPDDVPTRLPGSPPWRQMFQRREVVIALPLLFLAFGLLAWSSGLVDRLLAANAAGLQVQTGAFGDLLAMAVENKLGNYEVTLRRGADYPASLADWDRRAGAASDEAARLRDSVVREGQEIWVQLRDADDRVLAESRISLRPLVTAADAKATTGLPGRITAKTVVLSVARHEKK